MKKTKSFTMADRRSSRFHISNIQRKAVAFTMAEILLSLTIIGVVAAITLPSLTGNINERTWNTQRKALYARMSQAIALMGSLNGYGIGATESETASNAAKAFVTNGLAKVYKINNICDYEHFEDCGFPKTFVPYGNSSKVNTSEITTLTGLNPIFNSSFTISSYDGVYGYNRDYKYSNYDTKVVAFETLNGASLLTYYNPTCSSADSNIRSLEAFKLMCANFIYDLNGKKGPNTFGKDIGAITALYAIDSVVVELPDIANMIGGNFNTISNVYNSCTGASRVTNKGELLSVFYNAALYPLTQPNVRNSLNGLFLIPQDVSGAEIRGLRFPTGTLEFTPLTSYRDVMCIKRRD